MKLNPDCVRYILLYIEENVPLGHRLSVAKMEAGIFTREELLYAADKLIEAGFVNGTVIRYLGGASDVSILSITWDGHQFLDNIRPDTAWEKTKQGASKIGGASLTVLSQIASAIITKLLNNQLGL